MGTFAQTAIVDYRLLFSDQGKQTSVSIPFPANTEVCRFRFLSVWFSVYIFIYGKRNWRKTATSVCYILKHQLNVYLCKYAANMYIYIYIYAAVSNRKQKPRWLSLICLPFAHRTNESLLFVHLLAKKQTEVIHLQTDYTKLTCPSMFMHVIYWIS